MKTIIDMAERLWRVSQPALGSMKIARMRLAARGADIIDLGSYHPEIPQVGSYLDALSEIDNLDGARPADDQLILQLKEQIVKNHLPLRSSSINPEKEIIITPGIRMAASFLTLSLLNSGDTASYPDPGLQYFRTSICLADGNPSPCSLSDTNDYVINISSLIEPPPQKLRILFLNYPHNPTGAMVDYFFYRDLIRAIRYENILVIADCAYIHPGDSGAVTPLQVKGAKKKTLELHSFSTTFGINGLGFAVGHRDVISILGGLLNALGFSPNVRLVKSAISAISHAREIFSFQTNELSRRRDILATGLKNLGWRLRENKHVPFLWVRSPARSSSLAFARRLFIKGGVRITPGTDFGEGGEGWLRMMLHPDKAKLKEALERISHHSKIWQRKYRPGG